MSTRLNSAFTGEGPPDRRLLIRSVPSLAARHRYQPHVRDVVLTHATLRVAEAGSGPPLLLMNGIGAGFQTWWPLARRLSQSRRLIMFDAPGAGGSPQLRRPERMPGLARLVVELCDALGEAQVDVLGYSWGGVLGPAVRPRRAAARAQARPGLHDAGPGRPAAVTVSPGARFYAVAVSVEDVPDRHRA